MGKREKEHRKKVAKRNARLQDENNRRNKLQREFFKIIQEEKNKGLFDSPVMPLPNFNGPNLGLPSQNSDSKI